MPDRLVLVDASPYIFRAFFSLPSSMTTPDGQPVGAVYGFAGFLLKLLREEEPTHLAVAFDGSLTTCFRNDIYAGYKANRETPPESLVAQVQRCREVAEALGGRCFSSPTWEADDFIGSLVERFAAAAGGAVVVSSDKDLAQLVDGRVRLLDFARGERLGPAEVEARFGVPPARLVDLLALAGDPVDAIPGVRGIGRKTAAALVRALGGLDTIYDDLERVAGLPLRGAAGIARKLAEGREAALTSFDLATIRRDVPLGVDLDDLRLGDPDVGAIERVSATLGFDALRSRLEAAR